MSKIIIHAKESIKDLGNLYGLFFEDINHAADGGLYAELVQNRSFEFDPIDKKEYHALSAWEKIEKEGAMLELKVEEELPINEINKHYLVMEVSKTGQGAGICNLGFNSGISIVKDNQYSFSVYAKFLDRTQTGLKEDNTKETHSKAAGTKSVDTNAVVASEIIITLEDSSGAIFAKSSVSIQGSEWTKYETQITVNADSNEARLVLQVTKPGRYALDMVSLFPEDTFQGRKNGLRKDIAQMLADMKPKFMRFPGGCLVHDGSLNDSNRNSMYRWKRTIGEIEKRPTWRNNWGYNQTLGLGYYEYFCYCEDIGAEPLPVLPGGFNPHKVYTVPLSELKPWVEEALDLIEFANGDTNTTWGGIRADLGHPEPFYLKYIGIGNEEIGDEFYERYPYFHNAIREKYPDIKIINTSGPFVSGEGYETGWKSARKYGSDMVDEHYYQSPEWFLANMHHYDDYDPKGPKVFLGEYASWGNTYYNALVEAAYMTHLEKAPAVELACYAPMLCNTEYVNWKPDMIWFNNHEVYGTPNYYVQKLFMNHQGSHLLRTERIGLEERIPLADVKAITGKVVVAGNDIKGRIWDITITNLETLEKKTYSDLTIELSNERNTIDDISWEHYSIEMKFIRTEGRKGINLYFGEKDEKNTNRWEFGGWDNFDSIITATVNGRGSCISHRIFHVEGEKEYSLKVVIKDRTIVTYTNNELYNETELRLPELEELYVTSSIEEETGDIILKTVNLTGDSKKVQVMMDGIDGNSSLKNAEVYEMAGIALDAENSFAEPRKVAPEVKSMELQGSEFEYEFKKHSVTIIRVKK